MMTIVMILKIKWIWMVHKATDLVIEEERDTVLYRT